MAISGRVVGEGCGEFDMAVTTCMTMFMIWSGHNGIDMSICGFLVYIARHSRGVFGLSFWDSLARFSLEGYG